MGDDLTISNLTRPMTNPFRLLVVAAFVCCVLVAQPSPPQAGPVEILPLSAVKPGMMATAWTVFKGGVAEPIPVEILGIMENSWGPGEDIIMAKLGGKAGRTNVAGGMSGSPVYFDGKLLGAISLRFSVFSPDAIAGITPIELMLEINELDTGRPMLAASPPKWPGAAHPRAGRELAFAEPDLATEIWNAGSEPAESNSYMTPIETPLAFSGVHQGVLDVFEGYFRRYGISVMQGGGGSSSVVADTSDALLPGQPIAAVLISGDMSANGVGTVTYNDGKRILAFGHSMFRLGPVDMPMAKASIVTVLASKFAPSKMANSSGIVGALRQDRHSGIMGILGETASMVPISITVRRFGDNDQVLSEKQIHCNVFQNHRWTPPLVVFALFNSMFGLNDFAEETTFRLSGEIDFGGENRVSLETMRTSGQAPVPAPMMLAGWVGNKVQRILTTTGDTPKVEGITVTIDLLPKRRLAVVEQAWIEKTLVRPGDEIEGRVFLRPFRGDPIEKPFRVKIPEGASKGRLRLLISDAATLDRGSKAATVRNRLMKLPETVSLMNQEHGNHKLFVTLLRPTVTARLDDKTLPNVPLSVLNVIRKTASRRVLLERESPLNQSSISFDSIVSGSYSVNLQVQ
jgi:hypothetical protein